MSDFVKTYKPDTTPTIRLSAAATDHIQRYMQKQTGCCGVLLTLDTTGCSGLAYVVEMLTEVPAEALHCTASGIDFYIPHQHVSKLKGSELDYIKEGLNEKFVFNNPNESARCGCGESFTIDDEA